ncbi:hypothetical protein ENSA7_48280 [Enhygromyxa salina]|uniref:Uncharacterized protein n=1 Tax=Enhygromyxa salina TaxID=215803 RepID=A0A2S9YIW8_9BACT|nr:hypothetical protein ENSA7_48280 [Enhygromyxa salina]
MGVGDLDRISHERRRASDQLPQHHAERVDVGAGVWGLVANLLRGQVGRVAGQGADVGDRLASGPGQRGGQAKVDDVDAVTGVEQDPREPERAVQHALVVGGRQRPGDLLDDRLDSRPRERRVELVEADGVVDPGRDQEQAAVEVLAVVDEVDHAGVFDLRGAACLEEALAHAGVAELAIEPHHADAGFHRRVVSLVDLAKAPIAAIAHHPVAVGHDRVWLQVIERGAHGMTSNTSGLRISVTKIR